MVPKSKGESTQSVKLTTRTLTFKVITLFGLDRFLICWPKPYSQEIIIKTDTARQQNWVFAVS